MSQKYSQFKAHIHTTCLFFTKRKLFFSEFTQIIVTNLAIFPNEWKHFKIVVNTKVASLAGHYSAV